ncbi:hypothetical protein H6503_02120 [Candidatus Woesearchaeota archaeon]|nr:hypothetical protein [Candidatus Woesearchaeota archaeon]
MVDNKTKRELAELKKRNKELSNRNRTLMQELYQMNSTVEQIFNSTSWKLTAPLRMIKNIFVRFSSGLEIKRKKIAEGYIRSYGSEQEQIKRNNICFFAHYDVDNKIDDHVIYYIRKLHEIGTDIILISTCKNIDNNSIKKASVYCSKIILRENTGRDFGSWYCGIANTDISGYDNIILANDSVYGPLFGLDEIMKKMQEFDVWGITDSYEISHHLQSYFLVFKRRTVRKLMEFMENIEDIKNKRRLIIKYEIGITKFMQRYGFTVGALCKYEEVSEFAYKFSDLKLKMHMRRFFVNPSHFFWKELIEEFRCPFLKVELLRDNPNKLSNIKLWKNVVKDTSYDYKIIENHLRRVR